MITVSDLKTLGWKFSKFNHESSNSTYFIKTIVINNSRFDEIKNN